jgi:hypothetical protein
MLRAASTQALRGVTPNPVACVAAGSHSAYPEPKEHEVMKLYDLGDYATGAGVTVEPSGWGRWVPLSTEPGTTAFLGGRGTRYLLTVGRVERVLGPVRDKLDEITLPGVSGPRGPRYCDDGSEWPRWSTTVDWAGIFDLVGSKCQDGQWPEHPRSEWLAGPQAFTSSGLFKHTCDER